MDLRLDESTRQMSIPPHSLPAEQSVLGGLLQDNSTIDDVLDKISEKSFYRREHQLIFRSIIDLAKNSKPCDAITVSEHLERKGEIENVGGLAYLGRLSMDIPSVANIKTYAEIVRERFVLRQLIAASSEISSSCFSPEGGDVDQILDNAEKSVFNIAEHRAKSKDGFESVPEVLPRVIDRITDLSESDNPLTGLRTGFHDFDKQTSGLQRSDLLIIAGRPSMGKTTFAINIAENIAISEKIPVAVFSLEMPKERNRSLPLAIFTRRHRFFL